MTGGTQELMEVVMDGPRWYGEIYRERWSPQIEHDKRHTFWRMTDQNIGRHSEITNTQERHTKWTCYLTCETNTAKAKNNKDTRNFLVWSNLETNRKSVHTVRKNGVLGLAFY